jgi:hypothetical protein
MTTRTRIMLVNSTVAFVIALVGIVVRHFRLLCRLPVLMVW